MCFRIVGQQWDLMDGPIMMRFYTRPAFNMAFCLLALIVITACSVPTPPQSTSKEILIYCGITMIKPVQEIAQIFEKKHGCLVKIIKGGSGDLLKAIELSQKGDLYLPGESSYMDSCVSDGLCRTFVCVGYNRSVMVVNKNNPKNIPAELKSLTNRLYKVVIADPDTGSIGREAKTALQKAGLFSEVIANGPVFTTDSKDITKALQSGHADVGINWYATTQWPENSSIVDALPIPEEYAPRTPLLLGSLSYGAHPDLAVEFMKMAISTEGRQVFEKFGFEPSSQEQRS